MAVRNVSLYLSTVKAKYLLYLNCRNWHLTMETHHQKILSIQHRMRSVQKKMV